MNYQEESDEYDEEKSSYDEDSKEEDSDRGGEACRAHTLRSWADELE